MQAAAEPTLCQCLEPPWCDWGPKSLSVVPLELPENWTDTRETLLEGMLFSLKYMGMTLVEQPKGEELSAAAVKRIVATVSVPAGAELHLLPLKVCPRGEFGMPQVWRQAGGGRDGRSSPSRGLRVEVEVQTAVLGSPWAQQMVADGGKLVLSLWALAPLISCCDPGCRSSL